MYLMLGISREGWGQGKVSDPGMFLVELIISETSLKGLEKKQFPKANSRNKRSKMEERKKKKNFEHKVEAMIIKMYRGTDTREVFRKHFTTECF